MTLSYEKTNIWDAVDEAGLKAINEYASKYMDFLDKAQTERRASKEIIEAAKEKGFISLEEAEKKGKVKKGDKIYLHFMNKAAVLLVAGDDINEGSKIVGAHIDSPRLDIKANPIYEGKDSTGKSASLAYSKTHYYGGIKKYQWTTLPLAMVGLAIDKDGKEIEIEIGLKDDEPVFYVPDLLAHLSREQDNRKTKDAIKGEELNAVLGHSSYGQDKDTSNKVKENILELLNEKYGLVEEDFLVSELNFIPAMKAREVGFDRAMIAAYGHDDKVCAYATLEAILNVEDPDITCIGLFADKEEIGSIGATGMEGFYLENFLARLIALNYDEPLYRARMALSKTKVLSADVSSALDPTWPDAQDNLNVAKVGFGICLTKYVGSGGKFGANDANAEYLAKVRKVFDDGGVIWQTGEIGRVDLGGGGTIAFILAKYGAEIVDCGTAMLSMHAPYELVSKADAYMTYKAYDAFFKADVK